MLRRSWPSRTLRSVFSRRGVRLQLRIPPQQTFHGPLFLGTEEGFSFCTSIFVDV
jgi:hypothetical protein